VPSFSYVHWRTNDLDEPGFRNRAQQIAHEGARYDAAATAADAVEGSLARRASVCGTAGLDCPSLYIGAVRWPCPSTTNPGEYDPTTTLASTLRAQDHEGRLRYQVADAQRYKQAAEHDAEQASQVRIEKR
jgi:hypothetical protein